MNAASNKYQVRRAIYPQDRDTVIDLWNGNLGDPRLSADKFAWFYESSPTGEPLTVLLSHGADHAGAACEWAGVATAGARNWLIDEQLVAAGLLVDMTVTAAHRTLFPALTLQKALRQEGLDRWQMLYGFPNPKAAPVFARVGYRKLGRIVRYARVLRTVSYLSAKLPASLAIVVAPLLDWVLRLRLRVRAGIGNSYQLRWGLLRDVRMDARTNAVPTGEKLARGTRDTAFLRWRFADRGSLKFEFVSAEDASRQQRGWWVVGAMGATLHVYDCSVSMLTLQDAWKAWLQLGNQARSKGYRSLSFACLAPAAFIQTLREADLVAREDRPVFVATKANVESGSWFITPADEDE